MADHFYAIDPQLAGVRNASNITVATSSSSGVAIEVRVTDLATKRVHVVDALEWLADVFRNKNPGVIPADTLLD